MVNSNWAQISAYTLPQSQATVKFQLLLQHIILRHPTSSWHFHVYEHSSILSLCISLAKVRLANKQGGRGGAVSHWTVAVNEAKGISQQCFLEKYVIARPFSLFNTAAAGKVMTMKSTSVLAFKTNSTLTHSITVYSGGSAGRRSFQSGRKCEKVSILSPPECTTWHRDKVICKGLHYGCTNILHYKYKWNTSVTSRSVQFEKSIFSAFGQICEQQSLKLACPGKGPVHLVRRSLANYPVGAQCIRN